MNKNVIVGIVIAAVVVAIAAVALYKNPPKSAPAPPGGTPPAGTLYIYRVRVESGHAIEMTAYYAPLANGLFYGQVANQTRTYFLVKDGMINVLAQSGDNSQRATYYNKLLEICVNSTTAATVAGEKITIGSSRCTPSPNPLPAVKTFDDLLMLIQGLPGPVNGTGWVKSGVAQTPFGQATVYTNKTEVPIVVGLTAVLSYEKQVLPDGSLYSFKVQLAYGTQVAATLTYTLVNKSQITPEVRTIIEDLSVPVAAAGGGGLDILKVAEKIGMSYNGTWPAAVVFFDLECPYCARLFVHNYTLFQGHKLVLVDLVVHPEALPAHERLRCLYKNSPAEVIPTLRQLYARFLAGDSNYTSVLPQDRCPIDANAGMQLATLLAGQNVGTPMVVVVYPNGTFTTIVGYDPKAIAAALKG
ncbi:DsbA family protein [Pyrobaculum neutrophilum]|nr:hypothetical protein [Pyrobaculum neutrophilum]